MIDPRTRKGIWKCGAWSRFHDTHLGDTSRNIPRDTSRNIPRDTSRNIPRDTPRNIPRDTPRNNRNVRSAEPTPAQDPNHSRRCFANKPASGVQLLPELIWILSSSCACTWLPRAGDRRTFGALNQLELKIRISSDTRSPVSARFGESIGASRSRTLGGGEGQSIGIVRKTSRVRATGASWGLLGPSWGLPVAF